MELADAQALKTQLENSLAALIREFEEESGCAVSRVELDHVCPLAQRRGRVAAARVEVYL